MAPFYMVALVTPNIRKLEDFRHHAAEAQKLASECDEELAKQNWLAIAEHWLNLAEQTERLAAEQ